jgi:hypothetical protein
VNPEDIASLDHGGLGKNVDRERYLADYTHGAVMVLSREFRRWLRENCDPWIVQTDEVHFPCPTQSLMGYFERYEKLAKRWERTRPGNTRGLLKSLQVAYLRRTTPKPASPQPAHSPTVESSSSRLPSGSRK